MRSISAAAVLFLLVGSTASAEEQPDLFEPIATCISEHAIHVERAVPDLQQAAEFLAGAVCALESQARDDAQMKSYQDSMRARAKACREALNDADASEGCSIYSDDVETYYVFQRLPRFTGQPAGDALALAAQTLLELRIARLDRAAEGN